MDLAKDIILNAYERGRIARERGHYRVSPFYYERYYKDGRTTDVTAILDLYWFTGYDGKPFPEEQL